MSQQRYDVVRGLVLAFSTYYCIIFGNALSAFTAYGAAAVIGQSGEFALLMAQSVLFVLFGGVASFSGFVSVTAQARGWVAAHLIGATLFFLTLSAFEIYTFSQINLAYASPAVGIVVGLGTMQMMIALCGCICAGFFLQFVSAASVMRKANTSLNEPLISNA